MEPLGQPLPEPVQTRVTGTSVASLGQAPLPVPKKRGKVSTNKQMPVAPKAPDLGNIQANIQAARERSLKAVAPSAIAAARFGQSLLAAAGNQISAERDPRRRAQAGEGRGAPNSPVHASDVRFGHAAGMLTTYTTFHDSDCIQSSKGSQFGIARSKLEAIHLHKPLRLFCRLRSGLDRCRTTLCWAKNSCRCL